jgi:hypothetical protein
MKDVKTFLAELDEKRRSQTNGPAAYVPPPFLDPALEIALRHSWLIAPINGHSKLSFYWDRVGSPSRDRQEIDFLVDQYINLNWALELEASGVVGLEIEPGLSWQSLTVLTGDECEWQRTLHFAAGNRWNVLFAYASGLRSLKGFPGLRLASGSILIPPSHTPSGIEMKWADPCAPLLPAPAWLRARST